MAGQFGEMVTAPTKTEEQCPMGTGGSSPPSVAQEETFPRPGACKTGTFMAADSSGGVANVQTCEADCRGASTCEYYSYCPADDTTQCPGGNSGRCNLYSKNAQWPCGASTNNGDWAGYTSYTIAGSSGSEASGAQAATGSNGLEVSGAQEAKGIMAAAAALMLSSLV